MINKYNYCCCYHHGMRSVHFCINNYKSTQHLSSLRGAIGQRVRLLTERLVVRAHPGAFLFFQVIFSISIGRRYFGFFKARKKCFRSPNAVNFNLCHKKVSLLDGTFKIFIRIVAVKLEWQTRFLFLFLKHKYFKNDRKYAFC